MLRSFSLLSAAIESMAVERRMAWWMGMVDGRDDGFGGVEEREGD